MKEPWTWHCFQVASISCVWQHIWKYDWSVNSEIGPDVSLVLQVRLFKILQVKQNAIALAEVMKGEDGVEGAVAAFHKHLPHIMPTATELKAPKRPSNSFYGHLSCCFWIPYLSIFNQNALALAEVMKGEEGVESAMAAFHKHLPHNADDN